MQRILSYFKLDFDDIPLPENMKLPKWLNVEIQSEVLKLYGIPKASDEGEIMI